MKLYPIMLCLVALFSVGCNDTPVGLMQSSPNATESLRSETSSISEVLLRSALEDCEAVKQKCEEQCRREKAVLDSQIATVRSYIKQPYTGAIVITADGDWCPPCNRLKKVFVEAREKTWTVGPERNSDFMLIPVPQGSPFTTPTTIFMKDGKVTDIVRGFESANIYFKRHPRYKK